MNALAKAHSSTDSKLTHAHLGNTGAVTVAVAAGAALDAVTAGLGGDGGAGADTAGVGVGAGVVGAGVGSGVGAAAGEVGAATSGAEKSANAAMSSASSTITASSWPTGTSPAPSSTRILAMKPGSVESNDTVLLSCVVCNTRIRRTHARMVCRIHVVNNPQAVSNTSYRAPRGRHTVTIPARAVPSSISSPSFTYHSAMLPTSIVGDSDGMFRATYSGRSVPMALVNKRIL